jgi:hypothetical protein
LACALRQLRKLAAETKTMLFRESRNLLARLSRQFMNFFVTEKMFFVWTRNDKSTALMLKTGAKNVAFSGLHIDNKTIAYMVFLFKKREKRMTEANQIQLL